MDSGMGCINLIAKNKREIVENEKLNIKKAELLFIIVSLLNVLIIQLFSIEVISYVIFICLLLLLISKNITTEKFILFALFIPDKYIQLFAVFVFAFYEGSCSKRRLEKLKTFFLIYILATGLLSCMLYGGAILQTAFQLGIYYSILIVLTVLDKFQTEDNVFILEKMFWLQCIAVMLEWITIRKTGDNLTGTLISAHYLGVYLLIYLYMLWKSDYFKQHIGIQKRIIRTTIVVFMLYLADAKHVWLIFVIICLLMKALWAIQVRNKITVSCIAIILVIIIGITMLNHTEILNAVSGTGLYKYIDTYVFDERYNHKFFYFNNTLNKMKSFNGIFGYGVGQFGSQVSITMSKGLIYDWDKSLAVYSYAIAPYAEAIKGIMNKFYVECGISVSSMVLGYPLVSFVPLVAELGVIGLLLLMRIMDRTYPNEEGIFFIIFFCLTIFDTYLEIPCVLVLLLIAGGMLKNRANRMTVQEA